MSEFKISLGSEVVDKVSGFKGVVVARTEWHYGQPKFRDRAGADPAEWPGDLRVREWPR
ncbi:MAG: hypothetical protein AMXMBFR56_65940 [Polyangiaceae bacterium]